MKKNKSPLLEERMIDWYVFELNVRLRDWRKKTVIMKELVCNIIS